MIKKHNSKENLAHNLIYQKKLTKYKINMM